MSAPARFSEPRAVCWASTWSAGANGLEHVVVSATSADSMLLAFDEDGQPFRLTYRLVLDADARLTHAELTASKAGTTRTLRLQADGHGHWRDGDGRALPQLDGCLDLDIWPTPLTNSLPLWRTAMPIGVRREVRVVWVSAPDLVFEAKAQAYTRVAVNHYRFESLDGTGFSATLTVDDDGLVVDYPGLFRRLGSPGSPSGDVASPPAVQGPPTPLHHLSLGVPDVAAAARFYDAALSPLGIVRVWSDIRPGEGGQAVGYGPAGSGDKLALKQVEGPLVAMPGFHVAFAATSPAAVQAFHAGALAAGGTDNGAPGLRPHYDAGYYAAFVVDPWGHHLEAVCRVPPDAAR